MKVLIVNSILYTSETSSIKKVASIKDTMIYDLCLGFKKIGVDVTLAAGLDFKPTQQEDYPFEIKWLECKGKRIFKPNALPYCPQIKKVIKENQYDLIISSEVFSLNSFMLARRTPNNLIVWHELAKHNNIFKKIPSKLWYGIVAKIFFKNIKIVPRSIEAKNFISQFCNNVSDTVIDHGVNLDKFIPKTEKENYFAVCSQLIPRKRINLVLEKFAKYVEKFDKDTKLYIMGEGEEKQGLINQAATLGIENNVIFTGKLDHSRLINILNKAMAMLVYTEKDNSMVSIVESIAVCTPVLTTSVPYNSSYIKGHCLGIVNDNWDENDLQKITDKAYISNCLEYRESLATTAKAKTFLQILK